MAASAGAAGKTAYLMVDDAPSRDFAAKARFLRKRGVPAVFFCLGKGMAARKGELVRAAGDGFVIGNHAFSHGKFSDMPLGLCRREIEAAHERLLGIYKAAGVQPPALLFRFPYLDKGGHRSSREYFNSPFGHMLMNRGSGENPSGNGGMMAYTNQGKKEAIQEYLRQLGYAQPKLGKLSAGWYYENGLQHDLDVIATYNSWEYGPGRPEAPSHVGDGQGVLAHVEAQWSRGEGGMPIVHIPLIHDRKDAHIDSSGLFREIIDAMLGMGVEFSLPGF